MLGLTEDQEKRLKAAIENPILIKRELCRRDLLYFMKEFWSEISGDEFVENWHHRVIADELMQIARRVAEHKRREHDLIINVSPGTTKTAMCSIVFPVWCWINWPWMRFIAVSYAGDLSLESAEYSRDLVRSDKFRLYFPELGIKRDKDNKGNFRLIKHRFDEDGRIVSSKPMGSRFSTSVNGVVTGFHGHIIIVDDPLDPKRSASETELASTNRWIETTLPSRRINKANSAMITIMQRLNQEDPTGRALQRKKKRIRHICLPGEIINYAENVKPPELRKYYTQDGLFDPIRMPLEVLEEMEEEMGQYGYSGQIGQSPTPLTGGMFKPDRIPIVAWPVKTNIGRIVRYWDKAASTTDDACRTAGVLMCTLKTGPYKYVVLDVISGRWETEQREMMIQGAAREDGRHVPIFMEQEPGSAGKDSIKASIKGLDGYSAYADRPTGKKEIRADPYSVQVNNGNVAMVQGEWNSEYVEELRYFPNGKYKDRVDASSGAYAKLNRKKIGVW